MKKIIFFKCNKQKPKCGDIEQDGGIKKKVVTNAPKHIQLTLIIRFIVEMSTVADAEENEYCGYVYNFNAVLENGAVKELVDFFESRATSISNWTKMEFSHNHSNWDSCFCICIKRDSSGDMFAKGYLVSKGEEYSFDEKFCMSTEAVDALNHMKL